MRALIGHPAERRHAGRDGWEDVADMCAVRSTSDLAHRFRSP